MEILVEVTKETANFKLLKENDAFFLFSWSNFFLHLAYLTPFIYIPIRAHELGIIDYAFLLSIIGICSIPATIIFGIFSDRKIAAPVTIYAVFTLVMGSMFFIYTSLNTFFLQSIYALMFSLSMGNRSSLDELARFDQNNVLNLRWSQLLFDSLHH
jgi:predicted MFS family arabinose efflux permease